MTPAAPTPVEPTLDWRVFCTVCIPGEIAWVCDTYTQAEGATESSRHQRDTHWPDGYGPHQVTTLDPGETSPVIGYVRSKAAG